MTRVMLLSCLALVGCRQPDSGPHVQSHAAIFDQRTTLSSKRFQRVEMFQRPFLLRDITYFVASANREVVHQVLSDATHGGFVPMNSTPRELSIAMEYGPRIVAGWQDLRPGETVFGKQFCQRSPVPGSRSIFVFSTDDALVAIVIGDDDSGDLVSVPVELNCGTWLDRG